MRFEDELRHLRARSLRFSVAVVISLDRRYKAVLIQGTFSQQPSLRITSVLIPSEERVRPMDILYTPASNLLSFFFTNGALRQFKCLPDLKTGSYRLQLEKSVPLLLAASPEPAAKRVKVESEAPAITWKTCLTQVSENAFAFVVWAEGEWSVRFVQSDYMNELCRLSIPGQPSFLAFGKASMVFGVEKAAYVCSLTRSPLTLSALLRAGNKNGRMSAMHHVRSRVITSAELLRDVPVGVENEEEWKARRPDTSQNEMRKEEKAVLAATESEFETAALEFIRHRVESNNGVVSLSNLFIMKLLDRCIHCKPVCSAVLKALLRNNIDISVNAQVLPCLLRTNDISTLVLFVLCTPVASEANLLRILQYCLRVDDETIESFAQEYKWEDCSKEERRLKFLMVIGPPILRVNANYTELRKCMKDLTIDSVYTIGLFLAVGARGGSEA